VVTIARMYDFESVSVSSFEAASLAATLTEKSADGWDVVAIVPAGSDVVAYLRRSSAAPADADSVGSDSEIATSAITDGTSNTIALTESSSDSAADLLTPTSAESEPATTSDITSPTPSTSTGDTGGTGWGASDTTTAAAAGGWTSGSESAESSSWGGSAQQTATATPATPSVPAGWYADPAGRFELRYWDGSAWTEHVSRGGQQYTDPPVA
jgi:Protein of unknown function (DUF2510)